MRRILILSFLLLTVANSFGQDSTKMFKEMTVDLSDETEETELLDKGQWQVEAGFLYNTYSASPSSKIGQLMLRHEISKKVEVRMLVEDGRERDSYIEETVQSTSPLAIGTKIGLLEDHSWLPDISLLAYINLPFSAKAKPQKIYWSPMVLFAFQYASNNDKWKLDYNIGCQQEAYSSSWSVLGNASLHYAFTKRLEILTEYYAQYQAGELPNHNIGGGLSYQFNNTISAYVSAGSRIANSDYNRFLAGGIAISFE